MRKEEWAKFVLQVGMPVQIEVDSTPLRGLVSAVDIVGTFAQSNEDGSILIAVVRKDPDDAPNFINIDKYDVWHDGPLHAEYPRVVTQASTSDDSAMRSFLEDWVMIIPLAKDEDHHLPDVPVVFKAILEDNGGAS